jgi:uncharacterized protein YbjQ (UPF0145 family)
MAEEGGIGSAHSAGQDGPAALRYCVFISCPARGEATSAERCPSCDRYTSEQAPQARTDVPAEWNPSTFPGSRITTLPSLPGHRIVEVKGIVSILTSASGFTASMKGNEALTDALRQMAITALNLKANAIVGLTGSAFGAAGGITSVFGGDAVGILLLGTAVTVETEEPSH